MKKEAWIPFILFIFLASCTGQPKDAGRFNQGAVPKDHEFIRVSQKYPRYFETADGRPWIPVMINFIVPNGEEPEVFKKIDRYFKHFSEHGGNAVRIWISSPFLEIEDRKVGEYSQVKLNRIDSVLSLAQKYDLRIKFTLQHIRSIKPDGEGVAAWSNRAFMAVENGGPFKNIGDYINSPEGRKAYLDRVRVLSERYKNNTRIFSWELWNEMDAVDENDWYPFTLTMLDSVKALFPDHLVVQTLGSMHSLDADRRYEKLLTIRNNPYITVHRYLDPGTDWGQYERVHGPIDLLISGAIRFVYRPEIIKPVVANEHGAVEPNHTGPSKLYAKDTLGVFIHDMIFAPFFCGASGCGAMWHWDSYVEKQDLWYHYRRFNSATDGIDPVTEEFVPFTFIQDSVRFYGITGKKTTMIWCRDARNNWKTELQQGISPEIRKDISFDLSLTGRMDYSTAEVYNPWDDTWTKVRIKNGTLSLPPFLRSAVVKLI
jgi:hypothetical protein